MRLFGWLLSPEERRLRHAERELGYEESLTSRWALLERRRAELDDPGGAGRSRSAPSQDSGGRPEDPRWSAVSALVVSAVVTVVVLAVLVLLLLRLSTSGAGPESALSLVFVAAAVILILVVCTLTIVLKRLGLSNGDEAMGLPRGSIRAVIALLLILLFFIAAIFLFNSTRETGGDRDESRSIQGVDAARYAAIPIEEIQSSTPRTVNDEVVYDVVLYPHSGTETSDDIAKQLITILGTLVTAVAAFYFGANSVSSAIKEAGQIVPPPGDVAVRLEPPAQDPPQGSGAEEQARGPAEEPEPIWPDASDYDVAESRPPDGADEDRPGH